MRDIRFRTTNYLPHQKTFFKSQHRQKALVSGYGGGKSFIFLRETLKNMIDLKRIENNLSNGWIVYPTYDLAEEIFVEPFTDLLDASRISYNYNKSKHRFDTECGTIKIFQLQKPQRIVGTNLTFIGFDEFDVESVKNCETAYRKALGRMRGSKETRLYIVTTPEGFKTTYDIFVKNQTSKKLLVQARTTDNPFLPPEYIESLYENYDERLVKQYVDGQFINITQGQIYYMFDRQLNKSEKELSFRHDINLVVDFNVNPMNWLIVQEFGDETHVVKEFSGRNTNTPEMAKRILEELGADEHIFVYGDYSGNSRDTRSRTTDYNIITEYIPNSKLRIKPNPPQLRRYNSMNSRLCNSKGARKLFVNIDKCPQLVMDLEQNSFKEGTREVDKSDDQRTHSAEALGYYVDYNFPILKPPRVSHRI
jgi:hypothetical protein